MSTVIRSEISKRNTYWIERHRYYELKHFCLQYPLWKQAYSEIDGLCKNNSGAIVSAKNIDVSPTEKLAEARIFYAERMQLVEKAANDADSVLGSYILKAVTEGYTYEYLKSKLDIPCCREVYYELYRKFFWILNTSRK